MYPRAHSLVLMCRLHMSLATRLALELGPEHNLLDDNEEEDIQHVDTSSSLLLRSDSSFSFSSPGATQDDAARTMSPVSEVKTEHSYGPPFVSIDSPIAEDEPENEQRCETNEGEGEIPDDEAHSNSRRRSSAEKLFPPVGRPALKTSASAPPEEGGFTDIVGCKRVLCSHSLSEDAISSQESHLFSPNEVKKRSNSIKKERKAIALVTRESHNEDIHRARTHSDESLKIKSRRCSTHARLEGNSSADNFYFNRTKSYGDNLSPQQGRPQVSVHFAHFEHTLTPTKSEQGNYSKERGHRGPARASISMGYFSRCTLAKHRQKNCNCLPTTLFV